MIAIGRGPGDGAGDEGRDEEIEVRCAVVQERVVPSDEVAIEDYEVRFLDIEEGGHDGEGGCVLARAPGRVFCFAEVKVFKDGDFELT